MKAGRDSGDKLIKPWDCNRTVVQSYMQRIVKKKGKAANPEPHKPSKCQDIQSNKRVTRIIDREIIHGTRQSGSL